jgi:anti-sigma regulatory factor (Ser/Thr protein kinase)
MINILPVFCSDPLLKEQTSSCLAKNLYSPVFSQDTAECMDYLHVEMPELLVLHYDDTNVDAKNIFQKLMEDPWLLHGGLIVVCKDSQSKAEVDQIKEINIIVSLMYCDFMVYLPRILKIIHHHTSILFQRDLGQNLIQNMSGSLTIENDPVDVSCYTNLICNFLYNSGKLDVKKKVGLSLALSELLLNAIEHGNCNITYEEKSAWLESGKDIFEFISLRNNDPQIQQRSVTLQFKIADDRSEFLIRDEGDGFDWRALKDATLAENLTKLHGRGILLSKSITQNLRYNEKGNEVCFDFAFPTNTPPLKPGIFSNLPEEHFEPGQLVCAQEERSDFLYYIVSGTYEAIYMGRKVGILDAKDIFMGEMSFLLQNRRSASIHCVSAGTLIRISKRNFIHLLRQKPHYAIFLARLLARKIDKANHSLWQQSTT